MRIVFVMSDLAHLLAIVNYGCLLLIHLWLSLVVGRLGTPLEVLEGGNPIFIVYGSGFQLVLVELCVAQSHLVAIVVRE